MNIPSDLKYTNDHEWIKVEGNTAIIGITDFAQSELGDIVFVELPNIGDCFEQGDSFGTVEAVKTVAELYAPLGGEVIEVNESLADAAETINSSPYGDGWIIKLKISNINQISDLLDSVGYKALLG